MKVSQCQFCGDDLGCECVVENRYGEFATCGKSECEHWARDEARALRDEAHEQLDHDMGWL